MITKQQYIENPCGKSSLPYWKLTETVLPENMLILHDSDFCSDYLANYKDEPYFRLYHNLQGLHAAHLPDGYCLCNAATLEYAEHINQCYTDMSISEGEIKSYFGHSVYSADLWIAVKDCKSQKIAATGIAEFDEQVCEGILEWIQVSPTHRGLGLGTYIVTELLNRLAKKAKFATVSGQVNNAFKPENLYRKCGFKGNDVWHILRKIGAYT